MSDVNLAVFDGELQSALTRLDGLVERQQARQKATTGDGVSFDVSSFTEEPETGEEADLLLLIADAEAGDTGESASAGDTVHFGIEDSFGGRLSDAKRDFDAFVEKIDRDVFHFAVVETPALARTEIDWSGDAITVFSSSGSAREIQRHSDLLRKELMQRNLRLRMFSTVVAAAGKITIMLTTPGSALLALPMAFQFVSKLSNQWKEYQALNT